MMWKSIKCACQIEIFGMCLSAPLSCYRGLWRSSLGIQYDNLNVTLGNNLCYYDYDKQTVNYLKSSTHSQLMQVPAWYFYLCKRCLKNLWYFHPAIESFTVRALIFPLKTISNVSTILIILIPTQCVSVCSSNEGPLPPALPGPGPPHQAVLCVSNDN